MGDIIQKYAADPAYIVGADTDGVETTPVRATPSGDLGTADVLVSGGTQGAITVGATAVAARVGGANYTNRKSLTVMPTDGSVFWGLTNAVTTSTGTEIFRNQFATFAVSDAVTIWLIAATNRNVRVTEGA
jgi:hypothetical protein